MDCPHGWLECSLCAHEKECKAGDYKGEETDLDVVIKAAEIAEKVVNAEVTKNVQEIRGSLTDKLTNMTEDERWVEYYKYHPPSLHDKTPLPLDGPTAPGGGSKNKAKKSAKGNKVFTDVWSGF